MRRGLALILAVLLLLGLDGHLDVDHRIDGVLGRIGKIRVIGE